MAIRGILFDKDGTVIDYWRTWVPINREVALLRGRAATGRSPTSCCGSAGTTPTPTASRRARRWRPADFADIAEAFAAHPSRRRRRDLVAGIERIFCARRRRSTRCWSRARARRSSS